MAWSKSLTTQLACLCSVLLGIAHGRPTQEAHQQASEYVNVQMLSRHIQRNKRSLEPEFPHNLAFQFKMTGGGHVALDLQRSALAQNELPVYAIKRGGLHLRSTEKKGNYATYQDPVGGAAVLVKCPDQRPEDFELLGEFRYQGNHYHIEPASSVHRGKRDDATSRSGNTRHVVRRQVDPHLDFNGDALVPPPDSDSLHSDTGMQNEQLVVLPGDQVVKNAYNLKLSERDNKGVPLEDSTSATPRVPSSGRARREVETLYVEYIVVADYKVFQRWKTLAHGDTETEKINNAYNAMVEYYEFIVNGIDLRFRTATGSGPAIRVLFTSLLVSTDETTSPWLQGNKLSETTVDDAGMMYDFAMWKNSVYDYLPEHDHIGLFTGFDIATSSSTNPIGMGYLDSVCQRSWAVSETEETYSAMTVHIAAHELGHNLGSRHDGSGNACSSSALYLMAPRLPFVYNPGARSDPWTFSHCSQSYIRAHVAGQSASCLQNQPSYMTGMDNEGTVPAGLTYTPDEQCNMTYGQDAVLCRENLHGQWDYICFAMQCRLPGETRCEDRMFAFDRTPCGDKKWCRAGQCVYSEDAPTSHPTCPFGDDPSATCAMETSCEDTDIFRKDILCCGTCLHSSTTTSSTTSTTTSSTEPSTTQSATSSTTSTNISTSSMSTPEAEATPSSSTTIQVSTISTSQFSSTDRTLSTTVLISGSTSTLTLSSTLTTSSTSSTGDYESTSSSPESPTTSSEVTSVTGNSSSTSSVSTDSGSSTNATHTPTSLESTTSTSETTVSSVYTTTSVSSTDASTSSSSTPTDLTTPNSTSASVSVTAQPSTKSTPTSSNTSVTTASSSISSSPSLSTSALTSPISSLSTASVSSLSTQSMTSLSTSTFTPSIVSSTSATTSESTSPTTPESTSSTTSESTSSTTPESTSSTISEYTSPTISESTPPTTSESTSSATLESTSSTTPESTSSTTPESTSSTTSEYTSPTISESTPPTTSESTLSTTLESTSSNTPESTSSTTSESTSTDALPESQSSPVSTTAELTTNTTDSPYTTTPYQALPTDEPKPALTLKLQTLVSLFMAAAIVV